MHESSNPDLAEDHPMGKSEFWFEGTQRFGEQSLGYCDEYSTGIYEVLLLANGNLKFLVIEDECGFRSTYYSSRGDAEGLIEFEPVP